MKMERETLDNSVSGPRISFNVHVGGEYITLHMNPGERITFSDGGPDEEGYGYWSESFEHAGEFLDRHDSRRWSDCDGPGSDCCHSRARVDELDTFTPDVEDAMPQPKFERVHAEQWDAFAEAAGY